jgi:hypothetical protein
MMEMPIEKEQNIEDTEEFSNENFYGTCEKSVNSLIEKCKDDKYMRSRQ